MVDYLKGLEGCLLNLGRGNAGQATRLRRRARERVSVRGDNRVQRPIGMLKQLDGRSRRVSTYYRMPGRVSIGRKQQMVGRRKVERGREGWLLRIVNVALQHALCAKPIFLFLSSYRAVCYLLFLRAVCNHFWLYLPAILPHLRLLKAGRGCNHFRLRG